MILSMMGYLLAGWGLGLGSGWLLWQRQKRRQTSSATPQPAEQDSRPSLLPELQRLQLAYQMATEMEQFKAGFLVRASHELRSPLNSMIGLHQLILSDLCDDPEEEREFVAQAHTSALKMIKLLDEVLDVAKVEHGTSQLAIQPLQLNDILAEVYQLTHLQAQNRNLRLQLTPVDPEIYVLADPRWLKQILVHLVDRAITPTAEGTIRLSAHPDPATAYVQIWIEDQSPFDSSEPLDLLKSSDASTTLSQPLSPDDLQAMSLRSPGLTLLLDQVLLERMQGRLEVFTVPTATETSETTETSKWNRIQCSIPLLVPTDDEQI